VSFNLFSIGIGPEGEESGGEEVRSALTTRRRDAGACYLDLSLPDVVWGVEMPDHGPFGNILGREQAEPVLALLNFIFEPESTLRPVLDRTKPLCSCHGDYNLKGSRTRRVLTGVSFKNGSLWMAA